ncbi:autotransporter-associated beta strand repeat-containing protein [Escherichia coli]
MVLPLRRVALCILGLSEVTFDIADGKTLVIGNTENDGAVDSIAGTGLITKTGSGDLVLNADNNDFTGEMQIENGEVILGRSNSLMNVGDTHCQGRSARLLRSDDREY